MLKVSNVLRARWRNNRFSMSLACQSYTMKLYRSNRTRARARERGWPQITSHPSLAALADCPPALSCCWDNGSIRLDHDSGLDMPGTLEINACIMILDRIISSLMQRRGTACFWFTCRSQRESIVRHWKIPVQQIIICRVFTIYGPAVVHLLDCARFM